jgi:eukaryotic-like serine/threonine-protein kinase
MPTHGGKRFLSAALLAVLTFASISVDGQGQKVRGGPFPRRITLFDRQGTIVRVFGEPDAYGSPALSPDGTRLAVALRRPGSPPDFHIWTFDVSTGTRSQLTSYSAVSYENSGGLAPAWSPDGRIVAFYSRQSNWNLQSKNSNGTGTEETLYEHIPRSAGAGALLNVAWSTDGRFLTFDSGSVVYVVPLAGTRRAIEVLREEYEVCQAQLSSDSRFLAYVSNESGRNEVYVRAFDPSLVQVLASTLKWQISGRSVQSPIPDAQGGANGCYSSSSGLGLVQWREDDRELYYVTSDGAVMAVGVTTVPVFRAERPRLLFRLPRSQAPASISRSGQRVAFAVPTPPKRTVVTIAPGVLARYAGTYVSETAGYSFIVTVEGNTLMAQPTLFEGYKPPTERLVVPAGEKLPLLAESETYFFQRTPDFDRDFEFVSDDRQSVTQMVTYSGARSQTFTRKR